MTLKVYGWPWKWIGHLFYTTLCFVYQFKSMGEFKLELQSGNTQFRSKSVIFLSHVTLKFDGWPWKTIEHLFYATFSFVHHFKAIGKLKLKLQSGNTQLGSKSAIFCLAWLWNLTDDLEKNRAPLLSKINLCASFHSDQWILTRVAVRKLPLWVKNQWFFSRVTLKLDGWPWNTIGHHFCATSSFVHHFVAIVELKL